MRIQPRKGEQGKQVTNPCRSDALFQATKQCGDADLCQKNWMLALITFKASLLPQEKALARTSDCKIRPMRSFVWSLGAESLMSGGPAGLSEDGATSSCEDGRAESEAAGEEESSMAAGE